MDNKVLIIYGSLNSVPSPEGAAPAKIIEETVNNMVSNNFRVLSNINKKLDGRVYNKEIFNHVRYTWFSKALLGILKIKYSYEKRKGLFITASPQQLHYFITVCLYVRKHHYKKLVVHVSPGLVQMLAVFCPKVEIVFYHHGTSLHTKLTETQWNRLLQNTKAIFGVNEIAKEKANATFQQKIPTKKYYPIYNGLKSMLLEGVLKYDTFTIMFSGRICKEKGVLYLLKAYKILVEKNFNIKMVVAGSTGTKRGIKQGNKYLKKCLDYAEKNNLPIVFTGYLNQNELRQHYNKAHVLVLPTDPQLSEEGLSLSLIEGMSCGLPLIATNVGGNSELIEEGKNGFIIHKKHNYEDELAFYIEKLYLNKEKYDSFSRYSKVKYTNDFTIDKMNNKFFNALKSIHFVK